jgi:1-phosphofructokinase family hexose kinase
VLIAGPNLAIDRTSTVSELRPGNVLRLGDVVVTAGGKGVNVARAARALGVPAVLVGFLAGRAGRAAGALMDEEGLEVRGVPAPGELRTCSIILERGGRVTVLNEPGPELSAADWSALEAVVEAALPDHAVLVCSGSLPPGAPVEGYARLVERARAAGRTVVLDANGPVLAAALAAEPDAVTPNLAEAEALLGRRGSEAVEASPDARPRALTAAAELVARGARAAVVTAAAAGAAVARDGERVWLDAPAVRARNPIGAGDALTAGLAAGLERGDDVIDAVRRGVATAAASVESVRAGDLDAARMAQLLRGLGAPEVASP